MVCLRNQKGIKSHNRSYEKFGLTTENTTNAHVKLFISLAVEEELSSNFSQRNHNYSRLALKGRNVSLMKQTPREGKNLANSAKLSKEMDELIT
jgi:hypothetical protein